MSETNERSVASAGSVACEPAAFFVYVEGVGSIMPLCRDLVEVQGICSRFGDRVFGVVPLYRHPPSPLGDPEIAVEMLKDRVAELETAIRRLAEQDALLSVCDGNVTVTLDATLTDDEREAVHWAIGDVADIIPASAEDTLRKLLQRLK